MLEDWQVFIYAIAAFLIKHKQAKIKVISRRFGVIFTPFSVQSEKIKAKIWFLYFFESLQIRIKTKARTEFFKRTPL